MLIFLSKCRIGLFDLSSFNMSCNRSKSQKFYIPAPLSSFLQNVHNIPVKSVIVTITVWFVVTSRFAEFSRRLLQKSPFSEMWVLCNMTGVSKGTSFSSFEQKNYLKKGSSFIGNIRKALSDHMTSRPKTRCLQV
jgi:hypothetical protein